mmetsp:Transcript_18282/g.60067  ORF Transcript_18282/g.60067 Transcript_18282/m.60067 type:complete len:818 (-) Transcript_18282:855-3308(-)
MEGNRVAGLLPLLVSGNQGERSGATMVLREMETQPGFSAHLLEIGARGDVGAQVRWLAMMYLKNQVHRFWVKRSGIPYEIEAAEKSVIRENILPLSLDVDDSIANQSALIVAKISRFDFPKVWPNVLENIISALQAVSSESDMADSEDKVRRCNRVMRVLHYSIKDLSSKRLVSDRKTFLQLAPAVVAAVVQLWFIFRSKYISSWSTQSVSEGIIQGLVLTVKTLRRLLVSGFQKLHCDEQATSIAVSVSQFFRDLVASTGNTSASSSGTLERVAYFHGKFVHNVLAAQPLALVSEVDGMFVHYFSLCDISVSPRMITPKLQIVLLRCLHATVSSSKFIPSMQGISRAGDDPVLQQFIENVKKNLVADGLMKIIRGMTCQFVKVKAEEVEEVLEAGVNQLDAFERDEEDELESAGMSECGPAAYFALSIIDALLCRYGSTALHVLVLLQREALETSSLLPPQSVEADLVREACYHVIGSACVTMIKAKDLFEQVVVVDMAKSYLQNEFERFYGQQGEAHPTLILALRRAVWMLGKLVQADVSEEGGGIKKGNTQVSPLHSSLVPLLYSALEFPCTAVQVAAAASLVVEPEASDDWFDRASLLLPQGDVHCFLPAVCSTILKVSSAEDSLEVKNVAVSMLRGLASQIDPKSDQGSSFFHFLLPTISSLWLIIGSERRLQVSLLHVILDSANEDVMSANPDIFCQIIEAALAQEVLNEASSPAGGGSVILMETATDLWLKLMSTASSVEKHISLFARILPAIQVSRGPRETILRVMEAYLLLGGWERCQHVMLELSYLLSTSCREMNLREVLLLSLQLL